MNVNDLKSVWDEGPKDAEELAKVLELAGLIRRESAAGPVFLWSTVPMEFDRRYRSWVIADGYLEQEEASAIAYAKSFGYVPIKREDWECESDQDWEELRTEDLGMYFNDLHWYALQIQMLKLKEAFGPFGCGLYPRSFEQEYTMVESPVASGYYRYVHYQEA